jgi:hypothetical protein
MLHPHICQVTTCTHAHLYHAPPHWLRAQQRNAHATQLLTATHNAAVAAELASTTHLDHKGPQYTQLIQHIASKPAAAASAEGKIVLHHPICCWALQPNVRPPAHPSPAAQCACRKRLHMLLGLLVQAGTESSAWVAACWSQLSHQLCLCFALHSLYMLCVNAHWQPHRGCRLPPLLAAAWRVLRPSGTYLLLLLPRGRPVGRLAMDAYELWWRFLWGHRVISNLYRAVPAPTAGIQVTLPVAPSNMPARSTHSHNCRG